MSIKPLWNVPSVKIDKKSLEPLQMQIANDIFTAINLCGETSVGNTNIGDT